MNNELIKIIEIENEEREFHFKFKSKKCIDLEKATGKKFIDLLQDISLGNVCMLLKAAVVSPTDFDVNDLLDALMEELSLEKVMLDVIYETAVISGIISKEQKQKIDDYFNEKNEVKKIDEEKK